MAEITNFIVKRSKCEVQKITRAWLRTVVLRNSMTQTWTGRSDLVVTMALLVPHQARLALVAAEPELKVPFADELPSRQEQLAALQNTEEFDVLVVGGGATGVGCALDAVTRSEFPVNAEEKRRCKDGLISR